MATDFITADTERKPEVILYTDGACKGNPGPGGWAFVLQHPQSGKTLERFGSEPETTNNRMELLAVIEGLKVLIKPSQVEVVSDSKYVLQGLAEWMPKWKRNGWRRKEGNSFKPVKNVDLWQELDRLKSLHGLTFRHVWGHSGHIFNERCDKLASLAALGETKPQGK
jgi:ribonuclease HI